MTNHSNILLEAKKTRVTLWKRLTIVFSIILSDAVCLSVVLPFVPGMKRNRERKRMVGLLKYPLEMCRSTFGMSEDVIGMASGALVGIFSLAQFISSFLIGYLLSLSLLPPSCFFSPPLLYPPALFLSF